jgi:hypothetical protein
MKLGCLGVLALTTIGLLGLQGTPAAIADTTIIIRSQAQVPENSTWGLVSMPCDADDFVDWPPSYTSSISPGPETAPLGTRSWTAAASSPDPYAVGPYQYVSSISGVTTQQIQVYPVDPGTFRGAAYAMVSVDSTHYWFGSADNLTVTSNGSWHTVQVPADESYEWRLVEIGPTLTRTIQNSFTGPIDSLVEAKFGGQDPGGFVGVGFGCHESESDAEGDVYFDDARIGSGADVTTYDFEGQGSLTLMSANKVSITAGKSVMLSGELSVGDGGETPDPVNLTLQSKQWGSTHWHKVAKASQTGDEDATYRVKPTRQTSYRWTWPGNDHADGSTSLVQKITVHSAVKARGPRKVTKGSMVKVTGSVTPGKRGQKVTLWRGRHRLDRATVAKDGRFTLQTKATRKGDLTLVVEVGKSKGNLAGRSAPVTIRVR